MKYSLRTKLSISYALVAILLVGSISVFTNIFLQSQFQQYIIKQQDLKNQQFTNLVAQQLDIGKKIWNTKAIEDIGLNALEQGMILKVFDSQGKLVWDATVHNNGVCNQMLMGMASNMQKRYPNLQGGYQEKSYSLHNDLKSTNVTNGSMGGSTGDSTGDSTVGSIGIVKIGYYGPFFFNQNDIEFINSFNQMLLIIGGIVLLLALLLGVIIARRISDPIRKAILSAEKIAHGNFTNRIETRSRTVELDQLICTINNLAVALENRDKMQKRLTSDVAHELRTPLATLQSHFEAMIDGVWDADRERLVGCHEEILRINRLVGDLEELAKYDRENLKLEKSKFKLKDAAEKLVKNFAADLKKKNLEVVVLGDEVEVFADKDKISQVIINLLSNAIKFSEGGSIRILVEDLKEAETRESQTRESQIQTVRFSITDTGIGIGKNDLPNVFERFYRADESRSRQTGGSGIGLAIVKGIVEAHGGTISVQSEVGKGTTFVFRC